MSVKRARSERRRKARAERKRQTGAQTGPQNHDPRTHRPRDLDHELAQAATFWGTEPEFDERILDALAPFGGAARDGAQALLASEVQMLWARGWSPADLLHAVDRLRDAAHGDEAAHAVSADGQRRQRKGEPLDRRWEAQLGALAERALATTDGRSLRARLALTFGVWSLVRTLGAIPETIPPPGSAASAMGAGLSSAGLDQRMLTRIRALLAKAESTDFPDEAEALTAKAQELLSRHALDAALLDEPERVGAPSVRRIYLDDPYASAKASVLATVAHANRVRVVWDSRCSWLTAFGFEADLDALELLGTSLLVQATAVMAREGSRRDAAGRSRTRSFRRAFLLGFAQRIGQRLDEAEQAEMTAASEGERASALPVLAARHDAVEEAVAAAFPEVVRRQVRLTNGAGWAAGQVAGGMADLTGGRRKVGGRD